MRKISTSAPAIVKLLGEYDLSRINELRELFDPICENVVVDFSRVTYLDSSCIALLLSLEQRLQSLGSHATIVAPRGPARKIFSILQLYRLFNIIEPTRLL